MPAADDILDISPPFPLEVANQLWLILAIALVALLALVAAWLIRRVRRKPPPPPPTPREVALDALRDLAATTSETSSEEFAARASEILRRFIGAQFGLRAEYQTTPEFLGVASRSMIFPSAETDLLAEFLAEADRLKFGGQGTTISPRINHRLLDLASAFVKGGAS